tara:strand:+ start:444 stop:785 length:342 start_codon:yes stop_codon:yes gene_type:complete
MEPDKFNFTDEEFLSVLNIMLKIDAPITGEFIPLDSLDSEFKLHGLDSLGVLVFFTWIVDLFGISESTMDNFTEDQNFTVRAVKEFITREATQTYCYADIQKHIKGDYFGEVS